jgi:hypothetical protein
MAKSRRAITQADVPLLFGDACIENLATISKLPAHADRQTFATGIREAACIYARDARIPNVNDLKDEIEKLHCAAEARQFEQVATLLAKLSPTTRDWLTSRADRISRSNAGKRRHGRVSAIGRDGAVLTRKPTPPRSVALPSPDDLRDQSQREGACDTVAMLSRIAPVPPRNFPKRRAERNFVILVRVAWLEATGDSPSVAANASRPGPFVRMVQKCLALVGAGHADAVGIINWLNAKRDKENSRRTISD